ncbi:hypothetical protein TcG_09594 [Trypanosoma cruzi]|nr:hypothetical protein TcG_09594 [Trypanosoma cruzi]
MYRCHPAVPLTVLICLPVLFFFLAPPTEHVHSHMGICTVLCRNVFGNEGRWLTFRAERMTVPRWPSLTMTVTVFSAHTSTHSSLSLCERVMAAGAWSTAVAAAALGKDEAPKEE